jgi:hypothetical protein
MQSPGSSFRAMRGTGGCACSISGSKAGLASAGLLVIIVLFASHLFAQASPAALESMPFGRLLIDTQIGSERELGFKPPDLGIGFSVEKPMGTHVELQTLAQYSPDKKYITNDGNNFHWGAKGIWFPRWRVGVSGEIRQSYLWTSQFSKGGWVAAAGVIIRDSFGNMPGRFSVDYVIPKGCVWAAECKLPSDGIQSNRTQGPEFYQEFRALSLGPKYALRLGGKLAFYHFCDQANPLVIVPRTCHLANTMALTLRVELGGKDQWY